MTPHKYPFDTSPREAVRQHMEHPDPEAKRREVNPWRPMNDPLDLKVAGKLSEELGEMQEVLARLQTALSRCIIQGVGGLEPNDGKSNKLWLEEELADCEAGFELLKERFHLDRLFIIKRASRKRALQKTWHDML